ncbi:thiopeptide-type bacteriocin biosynthesis protein [Kribbella aluminosa]|uniref:Thiopeptide-type bacteriocin biosynthesis protein n=1 Tax=Kribbella aluminosa TaxID=416017 RepID=A0ABS4UNU0_9ACTN|nr:lantibiotic dehydratase [Kribbella aluminosa]MBP2353310.1 thiopeptide-type bacteriocin biosynthesis protein [Kribbella aluminosa]
MWTDTAFTAAIFTATPDLTRRVKAILAGHEVRPRQVRSTVVSVLRYRLRASSRATPFGRFAGVAASSFGTATQVRIGDQHREVARIDATWLAAAISDLEQCADLSARLTIVLNNVATVRDGRLVIGLRQHPAAIDDRIEPAEVSVRYTPIIDLISRAAQKPIQRSDLCERIAERSPGTARSVIDTMLNQLVGQRILITSLRPPMTTLDPVAHVLAVLDEARADNISAIQDQVTHLRNAQPVPADSITSPAGAQMDLRAEAEVVLPRMVAAEIEQAAAALARLSPHPFGRPNWQSFHSRFLERYGIGAAVPLLELVNPDSGLGFPAGYRDSLHEPPAIRPTDRDQALLRLAQSAALQRRIEVVLDEATISELDSDRLGRAQWPRHAELALRVQAPTRESLDAGEFTMVVTGVFRAAGATAGRFLDLLDSSDRDRMTAAYGALQPLNAEATRVQVSCPPLYTETENVARSLPVLPTRLSISEHPTRDEAAMLGPGDLLVVGDAHRLYLWSKSLSQPVEPELFSAVEFTNFAHPLLRFVCELSSARAAGIGPFTWAAASQLPFLPRLTYQRTILSPARWNLVAADLPGPGSTWQEWREAAALWRTQLMVPDTVYLGSNDQRLQLDLNEPAHLHLLRAELDRRGRATLQEAPAATELGWIDGHAHEIVVPVATTRPRGWPVIPQRPTSPATDSLGPGRPGAHLPGSGQWLFCKLYSHPDRHSALLNTHLDRLLAAIPPDSSWWFLPYRDPDSHLRLRIRLTDPDSFGAVARAVGTWAEQLQQAGLLSTLQLDTYLPETGRFGHDQAMAAAEALFAADSTAARAQRAHLAKSGAAAPAALTAASLVDLAAAFAGDDSKGARWLIDHLTNEPLAAPARAVYDQALDLASPCQSALRQLPGGIEIIDAWLQRQAAVSAYRAVLDRCGWPPPDPVLASLLHLHCVRANGIAPESERLAHRLARTAALSQNARTEART